MSRIDQSIEIDSSIQDCYRQILHFEHYPEFIPELLEIRHKGAPDVWHWEVQGPEGKVYRWDIELMGGKHQNESISWRTIRNADIVHSGAVTLRKRSDNQTMLHVVVEYTVPAGETLSEDLIHGRVGDYLRAFKHYRERGFVPKTREAFHNKDSGHNRPETMDKM